MNKALLHFLNPLHIYCRLRDLGAGKKTSAFIARMYERIIFSRFKRRWLR